MRGGEEGVARNNGPMCVVFFIIFLRLVKTGASPGKCHLLLLFRPSGLLRWEVICGRSQCTVRNLARGYAEKCEFLKQKETKAAKSPFGSSDRKTVFVQNLNHLMDANEHQFIRISVDSCGFVVSLTSARGRRPAF